MELVAGLVIAPFKRKAAGGRLSLASTFKATLKSQKDQIISSICKTLFSLNILCKIEKFTISGVTKTNAILSFSTSKNYHLHSLFFHISSRNQCIKIIGFKMDAYLKS